MIFKMGDRAEAYKLGGKAFELVKLYEAGFKVPPFLVLTGEDFFEFFGEEREELRSLLSEYKDGSLVRTGRRRSSLRLGLILEKTAS